jgi:hypothetical protein
MSPFVAYRSCSLKNWATQFGIPHSVIFATGKIHKQCL